MSESSHRDHQYALDIQGVWVNAKQAKKIENQVFFCDCPNKHKMKLVKPSGMCGKRSFCDYFAHIQYTNKKQRTDDTKISCVPSSESVEHRMAKQKLREMVGSYYFVASRCHNCSREKIIDTKGCSVSIEVVSVDKCWRYDCLLKKGTLAVAALEVVHTHATGFDKVKSVRVSGLEIAEFRSADVLRMPKEGITKLDNLKIHTGKCRKCLLKASYQWIRDCLYDEWHEVSRQEKATTENYALLKKMMKDRELEIKRRYEFLLDESKKWIMYCFTDEINEIQSQESDVWKYLLRQHDFRNALQITDTIKKCQALVSLSLDRLKINVPLVGIISFTKAVEWTDGVLVSGFKKRLPTMTMCIYLVSNRSSVHDSQWKHASVKSAFHIFLHCSTILRELSSLEESSVELKDCKWPILKEIEERHGICANCGTHGHDSASCSFLFCMKCGRTGHLRGDCFARRDVINQSLIDWQKY